MSRTQQQTWEAACADYEAVGMLPRVHFVVSFDHHGQQFGTSGPWVDEVRAAQLAQAEASVEGKPTYVISLFVDGITEVTPE